MSVNDAAGMPVFEVFADDTIKSYRNNESKFEVDPDNNRIRLRDNLYVSGNSYITGNLEVGSAELGDWPSTTNYAYFGHKTLDHSAADTYAVLQSSVGDTYINAAPSKTLFFRVDNGDQNEARMTSVLTHFNQGGDDVDFRVETDATAEMFFIDGENSIVGIGAAPNRSNVLLELTTLNSADAFIAFDGTAATDHAAGIHTTTNSAGHDLQGYIRVLINNVTRWIPFYDEH
jgi:hypothetical protein